ncbi:MAG: cytochrome P450 [Nitratireductor sp.]|nr:cytochrome P450 [Nitratireductor sp.]
MNRPERLPDRSPDRSSDRSGDIRFPLSLGGDAGSAGSHSFARYAPDGLIRRSLEPGFSEPCLTFQVGRSKNFILLDADLIRHCFAVNADRYRYSPVRQRILKPVFGEGLLAAEGSEWRRSRKAVAGAFSADNLHAYTRVMERTCRDSLAVLGETGGDIALGPELSRTTFRILSETLFSGELSDSEDALLAAVSRIMASYDGDERVTIDVAPFWMPRASRIANSRAIGECRAILRAIIDARLGRAEAGSDILGRLIACGRAEYSGDALARFVEDNIMSFLIPGHETSAIAAAWTLYLLSQADAWRERARGEVLELAGAADRIAGANVLRACVEESMRLFPPLPLIARYAVADDRWRDVEITAGATVMIATGLLHRQHRYHCEPDRFDPGRFLRGREGISPFAFIPFGAGPKTCIGATFALREAVTVVSEFLRRFDFAYLAAEPPMARMQVVTRPDNNIPMRLTPLGDR